MNFTANNVHAEITISSTAAARGCVRQINVNGKDLHLTIPAGIKDGQTLRLKGRGYSVNGGEPGDLFVKISVQHLSTSPQYEPVESQVAVARAVGDYLSGLLPSPFFVTSRYPIQIGPNTSNADVVLCSGEGNLAVIAKCERNGFIGNGITLLQSYLRVTDTQFGIFANSTKPDLWTFYENLGRNQFQEIPRSRFESSVLAEQERQTTLEQLQQKIDLLTQQKSEMERGSAWEKQPSALERIKQQLGQLESAKSELEKVFGVKTTDVLKWLKNLLDDDVSPQNQTSVGDVHKTLTISAACAKQGGRAVMFVNGNQLTVKVPAGTKDGQTLRIRGQGYPTTVGGEQGDLYLKISVS